MVDGSRGATSFTRWGARKVGSSERYRENGRRVGAANLASHGARRTVVESAAQLGEDSGLRLVGVDHNIINSDGKILLLVKTLEHR